MIIYLHFRSTFHSGGDIKKSIPNRMVLILTVSLNLLVLPYYLLGSPDIEELSNLAEQGDAEAQYNLAGKYLFCNGVEQNDDEALNWLKIAAEQGYAAGQNGLGFMYSEGRGGPQDHQESYINICWYYSNFHVVGRIKKVVIVSQSL